MGSAPGRGVIPTVARAEWRLAQIRRSPRGFLGGHGRSPVRLSCKTDLPIKEITHYQRHVKQEGAITALVNFCRRIAFTKNLTATIILAFRCDASLTVVSFRQFSSSGVSVNVGGVHLTCANNAKNAPLGAKCAFLCVNPSIGPSKITRTNSASTFRTSIARRAVRPRRRR